MNDPFDLSGKRALVTGASRGIGFAIAEGLAQRGAAVVITGRKLETLADAAGKIHNPKTHVVPVVCHQGDPAAIESLFDQLDRAGTPISVCVINAATNPVMGPLVEVDLAAWKKIIDVNLTGGLLTAQQAARRMLQHKIAGSIIIVASIAGIEPMPGIGAYSVSKSGLIGLTKVLAKELGASGIRVNALAPGLIETKFSEALLKNRQIYDRIMASVPLGRHGQPSDLVGAAVYLASDASAYMTGQVLVVDGGSRV